MALTFLPGPTKGDSLELCLRLSSSIGLLEPNLLLASAAIDEHVYFRRHGQRLGQRAFLIRYLNLASGVCSGSPELRQEVEVVVFAKYKLRAFLGVIRVDRARQEQGGLTAVLVLDHPNHV